jgi:hypothetical protein
MDGGDDLTLNDVLKGWHRRFQRSLSLYDEGFAKEGFDDLMVVMVTAAYIEGLLWLGIQFAGWTPSKRKKDKALGALIKIARKYGVIDPNLESMLNTFSDVRNDAAHDPDSRLERPRVDSIRAGVSAKREVALQRAFANILPHPSDGLVARLVFEQLVGMTFEAVAGAHRRAYGTVANGS